MSRISILPFTSVEERYIEDLQFRLEKFFPHEVEIRASQFDPAFAYISERNQHFSTRILEKLADIATEEKETILGVTTIDLFIPVLTFVFGESLLNGPAALVSIHRLDPRFYGNQENSRLLMERLEKTAIHELGHAFGLRHCPDYRCVMRSSNVVEGIDYKGKRFCTECQANLDFNPGIK